MRGLSHGAVTMIFHVKTWNKLGSLHITESENRSRLRLVPGLNVYYVCLTYVLYPDKCKVSVWYK